MSVNLPVVSDRVWLLEIQSPGEEVGGGLASACRQTHARDHWLRAAHLGTHVPIRRIEHSRGSHERCLNG